MKFRLEAKLAAVGKIHCYHLVHCLRKSCEIFWISEKTFRTVKFQLCSKFVAIFTEAENGVWSNIFTTFKTQKWKISECVREEIANYYKFLSMRCLWSRFLWHYIVPLSIPVLVVATSTSGLSSIVSSAIRFLFIDLTCFIVQYRKCRLLSRTYVLPKIECIFLREIIQLGKYIFAD